jgi:hypothetical protein
MKYFILKNKTYITYIHKNSKYTIFRHQFRVYLSHFGYIVL